MSPAFAYQTLNRILATTAGHLQSPFLLAVRLYWGWQFFQSGKGKLMNLDKTTAFFTDLGLPIPQLNAMIAGSVECGGGLLLFVGLGSRLVSLPLTLTMIMAYVTADRAAVQAIVSDPDQFVTAAPFLFLLAAVIIFVFGPGKFSLDAVIPNKAAPDSRSRNV